MNSGTLREATVALRTPDILQSVADLAMNVSTLSSIAHDLTERLEQVLGPSNTGKAMGPGSDDPMPARAPLACRIQGISNEANNAIDKLRSILDRLEV